MTEYPKIPTVWKRDPETNNKRLLHGVWSTPELAYLQTCDWRWTEKVDGTNIRVMYEPPATIRYGGRTDNAQIPAQLVTALDVLFRPKLEMMQNMFTDTPVCFYGEGYGAGIQSGGNYRQDMGFALFDIRIGVWLTHKDVRDIATSLGIPMAPVVGTGGLWEMIGLVREGFESRWGHFPAEGIVARPGVELRDRAGNRVICKLKQRDFREKP